LKELLFSVVFVIIEEMKTPIGKILDVASDRLVTLARDFVSFCLGTLFFLSVLLIFDQARIWLIKGILPDRDIKWLLAETLHRSDPAPCPETYSNTLGLLGISSICRKDFIEFTDWVGLNQMLNELSDQHVFWVVLVLIAIWGVFFSN